MKWVLCGITFALSVALAVGTASYRAGNTKMRLQIEREYRSIEARRIEVCYGARRIVLRRGWTPLSPACEAETGDESMNLD